jgi:hypothetical protein
MRDLTEAIRGLQSLGCMLTAASRRGSGARSNVREMGSSAAADGDQF